MNHPDRETWMDYLYGELPTETRAELDVHLAGCPECKSAVDGWHATQRHLDLWLLPKTPHRQPWRLPLLKWAAAAALILGFGFVLGRASASARANAAALRSALLPELRQQLRQEFLADWRAALASNPAGLTNELRSQLRAGFHQLAVNNLAASTAAAQRLLAASAQTYDTTRAQDHQALLALFQDEDQRRQADYASLHQDLVTLAINAQVRLDGAQEAIGQLAAYTQAQSTPFNSPIGLKPPKHPKGN